MFGNAIPRTIRSPKSSTACAWKIAPSRTQHEEGLKDDGRAQPEQLRPAPSWRRARGLCAGRARRLRRSTMPPRPLPTFRLALVAFILQLSHERQLNGFLRLLNVGLSCVSLALPPRGPPQVTPNDTQRHFSARIWAYRRPGLCHPTRPNRAKAPVLSEESPLPVGGPARAGIVRNGPYTPQRSADEVGSRPRLPPHFGVCSPHGRTYLFAGEMPIPRVDGSGAQV